MDGPAKAAMFLLSLPEERSVQILKHLDPQDLQQLREAIDTLGPIASETLDDVYSEFAVAFKRGLTSPRGGDAYLKSLVSQAHGEEQAGEIFANQAALPAAPEEDVEPPKVGEYAGIDPQLLQVAVAEEHPQVAAVVLAHLEPALAASVLEQLPEMQRSDLVRRIACLGAVTGAAFKDARQVLGGLSLKERQGGELDGNDAAATILNQMDPMAAESVLETIGQTSPESVDELRGAMFTFENLTAADTRGLQALLREVPSDTLLSALKLASEELKDKIFTCMSSRAADILREELEVMPPMRVSAVEAAQKQVVDVAMRLLGEGKISIEGRGEGLV
jgi:flagellar motor switch protein FliG